MKKVFFNEQEVYPSKIVCVGRNYVDHIHELGNEIPSSLVIFMKPNSAIGEELYTNKANPIHYEGELSFLIKDEKIQAVAFGLDLTKRELQSELKKRSLPWEKAKAFDGAALFSSFVPIKEDMLNSLSLKLYINDKLTQKGSVSLMMYKPHEILKEIKSFSTLCDGDIVMSGTPKGVGVVHKDDCFKAEIFAGEKKITECSWIAK